jgi:hypothetical protein
MKIAAFDLASTTGICFGETECLADQPQQKLETWLLVGDPDDRFVVLHNLVRRFLAEILPDRVYYEAPIPMGAIGESGRSRVLLSEKNVSFLRGMIGVFRMTCRQFQRPCEPIAPQTARRAVLGWGTNRAMNSGLKTKERVLSEARLLFPNVSFKNDNEADAFVLWRYACALANPRTAALMGPLGR